MSGHRGSHTVTAQAALISVTFHCADGAHLQQTVGCYSRVQTCCFRCADGTHFDQSVVGEGGAGWRWEPPSDDVRFSVAPGDYSPPPDEDVSSDAGSTATVADLVGGAADLHS